MTDLNSSLASNESTSARRPCAKCARSVLCKSDFHDTCIDCLGKYCDMLICEICQGLSFSNKVLRARRLSHWRAEHCGVCPPVSLVRNLAKKKPVLPHLQMEVVT